MYKGKFPTWCINLLFAPGKSDCGNQIKMQIFIQKNVYAPEQMCIREKESFLRFIFSEVKPRHIYFFLLHFEEFKYKMQIIGGVVNRMK